MNQNQSPTSSSAANPLEMRQHRRVEVRLAVTVVLDRHAKFEAFTCNVSEGGMLLSEYRGPQLPVGRLVGLNMGGVISDTRTGEAERYLMHVVRHEGEQLALRFAAGID
jgi:PilZ domain